MKPAVNLSPITILGAGSFGTALALYLARQKQDVRMWSVFKEEIVKLRADKANNRFLPGFDLPDNIYPMEDLPLAAEGVNDFLIAVPSVGFRQVLTMLKPHTTNKTQIISVSKGLDAEKGELFHDIAHQVLGADLAFSVLSGPTFAREVAAGLPTAVVIASTNPHHLRHWLPRFQSPLLHVYLSDDVVGVEICSVIKNVIAIATGISDGLALGVNARSALITCGLAEMTRLGSKLGAKAPTFTSMAGMGDLILTCSDNQSRNRRLGLAIGQGRNITEAEKEIGQAVEGKNNAQLVVQLAQKFQITLPICELVWQLLQGKLSAKEAMTQFLNKME